MTDPREELPDRIAQRTKMANVLTPAEVAAAEPTVLTEDELAARRHAEGKEFLAQGATGGSTDVAPGGSPVKPVEPR